MDATVKDYMTKEPRTLFEDEPITRAFELMEEFSIRHIPVVNRSNTLVGILSDRDLRNIKTVSDLLDTKIDGTDSTINLEYAMSRNLVTCEPAMKLDDCAEIFIKQKVGAMPVVDDAENLLGIISYTDVLQAFVDRCRKIDND